jgi:succinate dehydrogenase / fumarate reductase, membrane anchor subunit
MALRPNASPVQARLRTPLGRVRGLGSAKAGADHFWLQRLTAISNLVLVCFLIGLFVKLIGADYATVRRTLANPLVSIGLLLLVVSGTQHMRIGMQVIIEDYVHSEGPKLALLILNTFFAIAVALTSAFAVMKLSFGA